MAEETANQDDGASEDTAPAPDTQVWIMDDSYEVLARGTSDGSIKLEDDTSIDEGRHYILLENSAGNKFYHHTPGSLPINSNLVVGNTYLKGTVVDGEGEFHRTLAGDRDPFRADPKSAVKPTTKPASLSEPGAAPSGSQDVEAQIAALKSEEAKGAAGKLMGFPGYRDLAQKQGLRFAVLAFQVEANNNLDSALDLDGRLGTDTIAKINEVAGKNLGESVSLKTGKPAAAVDSSAPDKKPDAAAKPPAAAAPPLPGSPGQAVQPPAGPGETNPPLPGADTPVTPQQADLLQQLQQMDINQLFAMFMTMLTVMMQRLNELSPQQRNELNGKVNESFSDRGPARAAPPESKPDASVVKDSSVLDTLDAKTRALVIDAANKLTNDANDNFISRDDVKDNLKNLRKAGAISLDTGNKQQMANLSSSLTAEVVDDKNITPEELARILKDKGLIASDNGRAGSDEVTAPAPNGRGGEVDLRPTSRA